MVLAIPSPQETIDRLLERLVNEHPDIDPESFRLPIGELCNYECNVLSVRNVVPMLECYLIEKASKSGEPISEASDRNILGELVDVIIDNPDEHFVIVEGKRAGLTLDYLRNKENWISNHTAAAFVNNFAKVLGPEYSDLDVILSPDNPWLKVSRHVLQNPTDDFGVIQQLAVLWGGPREVYSHVMTIGAYFNRAILYEVHEDAPISPMKRRMRLMAHWVNEFEAPVEYLGQNLAILAETPNLFSYNRLLKRIPGFNLGMADVSVEFPDGSYKVLCDECCDNL